MPTTATEEFRPAQGVPEGPFAGPPSPTVIRDAEAAIRWSYESLLTTGLEAGFSHDGAEYLAVPFPSGDEGAIVAIGFSGIVLG